ncbi:blue light receptor [Pichia californica]|uniref:Blue light receptor n=1 Tax=Pichia californica TaxID=460514 RepID=A0A9P6WNA2_9ASCO|nr:blue light receptor [[Candida] californica]
MLTDISNDLRVHNNASHVRNQNSHNVLRPLKIVKRKANTENSINNNNTNNSNKKSNNNSKQKQNKNSQNIIINHNKMLDAPNYKFPKIYQKKTDMIFPFYECSIKTDNKFLKNNEPQLDFTNDICMSKNPIKKYAYPIIVNYNTTLNKESNNNHNNHNNNNKSNKSNIFFGFNNNNNGSNVAQDPIMETFIHMKSENMLRFGDSILTIDSNGFVTSEYSPVEEELIIKKRMSDFDIDDDINNDEEDIYKSDEGEISRLDDSDLDITDNEDSDIENQLTFNDDDNNNDNDFLMDSSIVSQCIPSYGLDNLHDGFLTNYKHQTNNNNNKQLNLSPLKRAMMNNNIVTSPQKQENNLFRALKNKSSPIKSLKNQRSGINLTPISKSIKKIKHTNYSKWDNSMTISAKAIMKMVDDSLVSSDTEVFNHSLSFMKSFNKCNNINSSINNSKEDFNINANDLMDALNDESETPLILRMKELKL